MLMTDYKLFHLRVTLVFSITRTKHTVKS